MQPLRVDEIKQSFVNCSRSQVKSISWPVGNSEPDWANLDFLGWRDPKAPLRAFLVVPHGASIVGLALRATCATERRRGSAMCNVCFSTHPANDVGLYVARKAGAAGKLDNTVGTYLCADLACSLYARGIRELPGPQAEGMVERDERVRRLQRRLTAFVDRALDR
jgi:hypothetical protein